MVVKGDIFEITIHGLKFKIGCLDSTSIDVDNKLLNGEKVDLVSKEPSCGTEYYTQLTVKTLNDKEFDVAIYQILHHYQILKHYQILQHHQIL